MSVRRVLRTAAVALADTARTMRNRLFDRLEATGGMQIPVRRGDWQAAERKLP